jgi:RNA polymerase sigma-70 factor (ECF subfamily)
MTEHNLQTAELHQLVDRERQGDPAAFNELVQRAGLRLEHMAHIMLGRFPKVKRWVETGDVLQSSLMRLLRALRTIRPASTGDFYRLAAEQIRRELIDLARSCRRHRTCPEADLGRVGAEEETCRLEPPDVAPDVAELDRWTAFHEAVAKLPAKEREVFGLVFYHGWTQPQIAELLQITDRQVRRLWKSACLTLDALLDGNLPILHESGPESPGVPNQRSRLRGLAPRLQSGGGQNTRAG